MKAMLAKAGCRAFLNAVIIEESGDYLGILAQPMTPKETERLEHSEKKSTPYGDEEYVFDIMSSTD